MVVPRIGRRFVVPLAFVLAVAGCLSGPTHWSSAPSQPTPVAIELSLRPESRALVSTPSHRISEFVVAADPADPDHFVAGAVDYDDPQGMAGCVTFYTFDGGRTWSASEQVPNQTRERLRLDAYVTIDLSGRAHLVCLENAKLIVEHPNAAVWHSSSGDGGRAWSSPRWVPPRTPTATVDKESVYAARDGTLYVCVVDADTDEVSRKADIDLVAIRSRDGGATWLPPVAVKPNLIVCNGMMESSRGEVLINWFSLGGQTYPIGTAITRDQGETWTVTDIGNLSLPADWAPHGRFAGVYPGFSAPSAAVRPTNDAVMVAAQEWNLQSERWEIRLYLSHDLGATYEPAAAPTISSPGCAGCHAFHPAIAFDPQGRLGLQVQLAQDLGLVKEVWFIVSPDEGRSWSRPVMLSRTTQDASWVSASTWLPTADGLTTVAAYVATHPTDPYMPLHGYALGQFVGTVHHRWGGDYWGIAATQDGFLAMWVDASQNGVPQLWSSRIGLELASPAAQLSGTAL